jgi:hypothetical protein
MSFPQFPQSFPSSPSQVGRYPVHRDPQFPSPLVPGATGGGDFWPQSIFQISPVEKLQKPVTGEWCQETNRNL